MGSTYDRGAASLDLYETLGIDERSYLTYEFELARRAPNSFALLRAMPYPFDAETAASITGVAKHYVIPWQKLRERYLASWVRDRLLAEGQATLLPWPMEHIEEYFPNPDDRHEYERRADFTYGLAGIRDAEVEEECDSLRGLIEAAGEDDLIETGVAVAMALPLGPPSLGWLPLFEGEWLDQHLVELAEWLATVVAAGYGRLPAFDRHSLAWHRLYPPGTNWSAPCEADCKVIAELRRDAAIHLNQFSGRTRKIEGQPYLHFASYCDWTKRRVPGDLSECKAHGLVVKTWNAWIDRESDDGRLDLHGDVVERIDHPIAIQEGRDYIVLPSKEVAILERVRASALAEWRELAVDQAIKRRPEDILSNVQCYILQALERAGEPLSADELALKAGVDRSQLFQRRGIKELMERDPPLVLKGPKRTGYVLARVHRD